MPAFDASAKGIDVTLDSAADSDYSVDTYLWKTSLESRHHVYDCLGEQTEITPDMRSTLLEWLIAVNRKGKCSGNHAAATKTSQIVFSLVE